MIVGKHRVTMLLHVFIAVCVFFPGSRLFSDMAPRAEPDGRSWRPVQFSLWDSVQLADKKDDVYGIRIGLLNPSPAPESARVLFRSGAALFAGRIRPECPAKIPGNCRSTCPI